ncbi:hypothetical protein NMG60_11030364 [Bertholletia excelsa]
MASLRQFSSRDGGADRHATAAPEAAGTRKPTKLLLKVNVEGSPGPVQVVISPENTVGDLVKATVEIYVREKRRPLLAETDPRRFELHYSQFSLESLNSEEKLISLESRNFYLCQRLAASSE